MCWSARDSSLAGAMHSGGRAVCKPRHSRRPRAGSRSIAGTGNDASIVSTDSYMHCKRRRRKMPAKQSRSADTSKDTGDREMVIVRMIAAPRELVFQAFTDREHIGLWWGPN